MKNLLKFIERSIAIVLTICFIPAVTFLNKALASNTVTIMYSKSNNTFVFAAQEMKKALEASGYIVKFDDVDSLKYNTLPYCIIITVRGTSEAKEFLNQSEVQPLPPQHAQGYSIRKKAYTSNTYWCIIGSDKNGALYGSQDFSLSVQFNGIKQITNLDKNPYISNRGIKFNIPLDARTPSYSDNGDAAQKNIANMWDISFWQEFLDNMARNRFNLLSLWSLSPFPSLVNVPEYPNAAINDVKKTQFPLSGFKTLTGSNMSNKNVLNNLVTIKTITINDKIKFWQKVMQYASDRGIDCYLFTWNTFVFGTENSGYGFTPALTNNKTKDYFRKATKALILTYPLLKGIGITSGENMQGNELEKETFLFDTYGQGINDALAVNPSRKFKLIHRTHWSNVSTTKTAFSGLNPQCALEFSYKYSQAHLYSSHKPNYIYKDNFLDKIGSSKFFLTVRDDDWYYLRGGSDPAFARLYLKNIPKENFSGFYLGPDGYTWGREYISKNPDFPNQLIFNKRWYSFQIWGKLAYDPNLPDSLFKNILKARFPDVNAQNLYTAWAKSSQIIPWVNRFHNVGCQFDYQWYPEACFSNTGFHTVNKFISTGPQSGEGLMSIPSYTNNYLKGLEMTGTTPLQVAQNLQAISDEALSLIATISSPDKELRHTLSDITAMAYLGKYYSKKIYGATYKFIAESTSDSLQKEQYKYLAITYLRDASECWRNYASEISISYIPQWLTRMQQTIDVKAIQSQVDNDILLAGGTLNRVAATKVTVSPTCVNIYVNNTRQLKALVSPANATNNTIHWSSSNNFVATVNANGQVKGIAVGNAIITATTLDGNKTAICNITIIDKSDDKLNFIGSWVQGTSHTKEAGKNRGFIVFIYGEHTSAISVSSVKYGGQLMTPIAQKSLGTTTNSFTGAFLLNEAGINAAMGKNIDVTWSTQPNNGSAIISAFFINVNQLSSIGSVVYGGNNNAVTVSTNPLAATSGDAIILAATAAYNSYNYSVNNGFIKTSDEQNLIWGDVVAGYKIAKQGNETPSVSMPSSMRQCIIGFILKKYVPDKLAGIENIHSTSTINNIKVYPNPVINKNFIIEFDKPVTNTSIQILDLSGRLLLNKMIQNETVISINVNTFTKGLYFLKINTNKNHFIQKKILIE